LEETLANIQTQLNNLTNKVAYNNGIIQIQNDKGENQGIVVKTYAIELNNSQHSLFDNTRGYTWLSNRYF
jgi:hypothetical protein